MDSADKIWDIYERKIRPVIIEFYQQEGIMLVSPKVVCTKCGSDEIYIEQPKQEKEAPTSITLDEMVKNMDKPVPAVYHPTTWRCKKCGYSVTK